MENLMAVFAEWMKYMAVFAISMFKFVGGPLTGVVTGLSLTETIIFTFLGMMASVLLFVVLLGDTIKKWIKLKFNRNKKLFSNKNRRIVRVWNGFGLKGVAFLTPILLTPIVGTMIATSFGETKTRIVSFMMISALFWSIVISSCIYLFKNMTQTV